MDREITTEEIQNIIKDNDISYHYNILRWIIILGCLGVLLDILYPLIVSALKEYGYL